MQGIYVVAAMTILCFASSLQLFTSGMLNPITIGYSPKIPKVNVLIDLRVYLVLHCTLVCMAWLSKNMYFALCHFSCPSPLCIFHLVWRSLKIPSSKKSCMPKTENFWVVTEPTSVRCLCLFLCFSPPCPSRFPSSLRWLHHEDSFLCKTELQWSITRLSASKCSRYHM